MLSSMKKLRNFEEKQKETKLVVEVEAFPWKSI